MSEYALLTLDGYEIDSWRNCVGPPASFLFCPSDGTQRELTEEERAQADPLYGQDPREVYACSAAELIQRLEILGYTLTRSRERFETGMQELIDEQTAFEVWDATRDSEDPDSQALETALREEVSARYPGVTFDGWLNLMARILGERLEPIYDANSAERESVEGDPLLLAMLDRRRQADGLFAFPDGDAGFAYRALLEVARPDAQVELDYTSLVGCVDADAYTCSPPKTIILCEGKSDQRILEASLRLRFPHLQHYYSFMEFESTSLQGSTGQLLNLVRAFVGAGIENRVIAVFDNDTAGHDALRTLGRLALPPNLKVMALPDTDLARDYPTLGPQGGVNMDVNQSAASIELYLGRDILTTEEGNLSPVQWTGYCKPMGRYQGEVLDKDAIQQRYLTMLATAAKDPGVLAAHDWQAMDAAWNSIFAAFAI